MPISDHQTLMPPVLVMLETCVDLAQRAKLAEVMTGYDLVVTVKGTYQVTPLNTDYFAEQ
jgi:hypothetical protein